MQTLRRRGQTATTHRPHTPEEVDEAVQRVLWWPSTLLLLVLGLAYSLSPDTLTIGSPWLVLVVVVPALVVIYLLRWRGMHAIRRKVALAMLLVLTVAVAVSSVFLLVARGVVQLCALE